MTVSRRRKRSDTRRWYKLTVVPEGDTPDLLENTSVTHHRNVDAAMTTDGMTDNETSTVNNSRLHHRTSLAVQLRDRHWLQKNILGYF